MQLSPNKWPHFSATNRCSPFDSHVSKQIEHVEPSSSSLFKGGGGFFGESDLRDNDLNGNIKDKDKVHKINTTQTLSLYCLE